MKEKININRMYISTFLYIFLPILIGVIAKSMFQFQTPLTIAVLYSILLIFLIPSDSLFGSVLDYNAKSINPTFRPDKKEFISSKRFELIRFILVLISLITTIIIWYYTSI